MKQFPTIYAFELTQYLKNRLFQTITIIAVLGIAIFLFFPRFLGSDEDTADIQVGGYTVDAQAVLISGTEDSGYESISTYLAQVFAPWEITTAPYDEASIRSAVTAGDVDFALVFSSPSAYTYYVNDLGMYDFNGDMIDSVLLMHQQLSFLSEAGLKADDINTFGNLTVTHDTVTYGKDQMQNFFYAYILIFGLYMVILVYGQMVASNVAMEKSSRAMELLITSANPVSMMFGKVLASCTAGLLQLLIIVGCGMACYQWNLDYWGGNAVVASIFDIPPAMLIYMVLFFLLGFLLYAFLYGAAGSTASKIEDISTAVMPITFLFIAGFFVVVFSLSSGNADNLAMKICSYVPFFSPIAMFARIAISDIAFVEVAISIGILILSVIGIGVLTAKIYRVGVLLYGTTPRIGSILKALRRA